MRRVLCCAGVVAASALGAAVAAATGLPPSGEWVRLETEHFVVLGQSDDGELKETARRLEALHLAIESRFPDATLHSRPTYVFAFRDRESFRPYSGGIGRTNLNLKSRFLSLPDRNYVATMAATGLEAWEVIYREYVGWLLRDGRPDLPLWLDVGLREVFAEFAVVEGRGRIGVPRLDHVAMLRDQDRLPLEQVLAVRRRKSGTANVDAFATFRGWSWLLAHYFHVGNPAMVEGLDVTLRRLDEGASADEAVQEGLGISTRELSERISAYLSLESLPHVDAELEGLDAAVSAPVEALTRADYLVELGALLVNEEPTQALAGEHFREALRLSPRHAPAHRGLAELLERQGRDAEAAVEYRQASEIDPNDPSTMLLLAENLFEKGLAALELGDETAAMEPLGEAQALLERFDTLRPSLGHARALLGRIYTLTRNCEGLPILEDAHARLPGRHELALDLAVLLARCGRPARARALVDRVPISPGLEDPLRNALSAVLEAELREVQKLALGGSHTAAAELLAKVIDRVHDPRLRARLEDRLLQLRQLAGRQTWVERYQAAYDLLEQGRLDEAAEGLREIHERSGHPDLIDAASDQLRRIEARRSGS